MLGGLYIVVLVGFVFGGLYRSFLISIMNDFVTKEQVVLYHGRQ